MQNKIENYCLVGFGTHSKNKLLPSLEKTHKNIFGIVSSKNKLNLEYEHYNDLQDALEKSNKSTIFIIASPPKVHFMQMKKIIKAERNIFVEKPIFTSFYQAKMIQNFLKGKNLFIVELLMYKYTNLYEKFQKIWEKKRKICTKIECFFNIPSVPYGTFRNKIDLTSSPLYDIGCYILSLLINGAKTALAVSEEFIINQLRSSMVSLLGIDAFGVPSGQRNYIYLCGCFPHR